MHAFREQRSPARLGCGTGKADRQARLGLATQNTDGKKCSITYMLVVHANVPSLFVHSGRLLLFMCILCLSVME
jgi:hypothetical protein